MKHPVLLPLLALASLLLPVQRAAALDFERDIQPILKDHCFKCHSGPRAKAKLRYDDARYFAEAIGTHAEAVVVPGDPERSKMLRLASLPQTNTDAMPPRGRGESMNSAELAKLRRWIEQGASLESNPDADPPAPDPAPAAPESNKVLEWTNIDGASLRAVFVASDGTSVKLRKEDGTEFEYPLSKLSEESRQLARLLAQ